MARIVVGVYMVRYPLGGMLSMALQIVLGLRRLGHEVVVVEKSGWESSCFDPVRREMTDDCAQGTRLVGDLLSRHGLGAGWCFVDQGGRAHGMSESALRDALASCDAFIDAGTHGLWLDDLGDHVITALLDGEPGWTQMRWDMRRRDGMPIPGYDAYFTVGQNVGTPQSTIPTLGLRWRHVFYPVLIDEFEPLPPHAGAAFTTVMNWRAHDRLEYDGAVFGQKGDEFDRFAALPRLVARARFLLAVAGTEVPRSRLSEEGWNLRSAHEVTASYDGYRDFVRHSRGEFSVAKNVFVATGSGWFGDRSAVYLASGRPVVLQDTGIAGRLPVGEGLFTVRDADEAAAAVESIEGDYARHSAAAREIAREHLATDRVLPPMLEAMGL